VGASEGQGNITMYSTAASQGGACNYGATNVMDFAAVNVNVVPGDGQGQWQGGRICGQCAQVTALTTQGPRSVVVRIMDKCPDVYCGIDLGGAAPAAIMLDGFGRYEGSWRFVSCAGHAEVFDGSTSLFVFAGSNTFWSRVHVRNPPSAVLSLDWKDTQGASGSFPFASDPENAFEVPTQVLQSTAKLVLTARFNDGSAKSVDLVPGQLAAENTLYDMN
jgi:Barwin family